jgi:hypothetical protein
MAVSREAPAVVLSAAMPTKGAPPPRRGLEPPQERRG